ncbi:glycoside hydrolase family 38 C-terminal domain-containing protein [Cognatishimia sp. F0-27]|uniref:alpha-mannosidase n=1 Tax=Cognatishimia sp. F0-27 TaxID=2816855 RepID=UPI001D0C9EC6|nr:glycoside hydrolase family 38 C-terminal domain-containing protein [Cognatishimia sp. F0-27]MCC1491445.1 alpha-mannosidase [Cognatishimia sp. F0-27]
MSGRWPFIREKIAQRLSLIAPFVARRRQPLPPFRLLCLPAASVQAPICADPSGWDEIPHESYWGKTDLNFILKSRFQVPQGWNADRIALHLPLGVLGDIFNHPEALVHVDARPIASADRYHHTIRLDAALADGKPHELSLQGWTGHTDWPPDPASKAKLFMGTPALVERDETLLAFYTLAHTMLDTTSVLPPDDPVHQNLLAALDAAFKVLDTRAPLGDALYDSAAAALATLEQGKADAGDPLDVTLHGIGHAHIDIAYLWPIAQTRLKNARTCSNVLRLMEDDPDYRFSHSQPQLYAMMQADYPALFEQIKTRVAEGRWEVMGGMWVEPDLNIPGPEALVRQLTLGRSYFREAFGDVETPVLWLPDTFGFPAQIPQLMRLAGLKWFATNKLNWNQINPVASSSHQWEGLDGSRVLAHVLTTPRSVQYLPFPTNYKSDLSAPEVLGTWDRSTAQEHVHDLPICYGYGDGGGGPTETLLAKAHIYAEMPGMPRFKMSTVRATFEAIEATADDLPVHRGEHYMEGHRGVLTSQGWIKRANRKAEWALHEAESLSAMAGLTPDLTEAWQLLCLNQFHDIVTGTSVAQVFADARKDYARIMDLAEAASQAAAKVLATAEPVVANTCPTNGPRLALVEGGAHVPNGQPVSDGVLALLDTLPSYAITPVRTATMPHTPAGCRQTADGGVVLENQTLQVFVDGAGRLSRVYDKGADKDVIQQGTVGNQLQAFEDRPICWDAWDIDPSFEDRQDAVAGDTTIEVTETGPLRVSLRVTTVWRSSTIVQDIRLAAHSSRIDFVTRVDWHEQHTLLKAAFPVTVHAPVAQFDSQWGMVERATTRDTPFDAARFEVPAQKWAQLREESYAVALLNDCKYGYDVRDATLRITLIKSSTSPDPQADQGAHCFTYSLLPIAGANFDVLHHEAYDLNAPLRIIADGSGRQASPGPLVTSDATNVIVQTVKPSEDGRGFVVRLFEAAGQATQATLRFDRAIASATEVDIFEVETGRIAHSDHAAEVGFGPFQIKSVRVQHL